MSSHHSRRSHMHRPSVCIHGSSTPCIPCIWQRRLIVETYTHSAADPRGPPTKAPPPPAASASVAGACALRKCSGLSEQAACTRRPITRPPPCSPTAPPPPASAAVAIARPVQTQQPFQAGNTQRRRSPGGTPHRQLPTRARWHPRLDHRLDHPHHPQL
jgi:hypothetical protein